MTFHQVWRLDPDGEPMPALPVSSPAIHRLLVRRGVTDEGSYRKFTAPSHDDLHDGRSIHGIDHAAERIGRAIRDGERILIYGDYDVDGVTSIVLLQTVLRRLGAVADHVVPHRLVDGYGLKMEVLDRVLAEKKVGLVITVDCGITSVEPVRLAIERGIDVIITDHHLPPGVLPSAAAVLNPKQPGCEYPFKELAGVGVAFKLCCELVRRHGSRLSIESLLKIAAIGTIADVAPLVGENRTIARLGLAGLADPRNPGLRVLVRSLGLQGRPLRAADIGFRIGPRINAAGRLRSASTAIQLFECSSDEEAMPLVEELNRLNDERKLIERSVREAAEGLIPDPLPPVLLLAGEGWHRGVVGLAAARIAQKWYRPALVATIEGEWCIGSGRSVADVDLHERLERLSELFTHFGGHSYACGFTFPLSALPLIRERLAEAFSDIEPSDLVRTADIDARLTLGECSRSFLEELQTLEPFGAGNPQPLFLVERVRMIRDREFSPGCHEITVQSGSLSRTGVVWPDAQELMELLRQGGECDLLVQVEEDSWSGWGGRLVVVDARPEGEGAAH